jgi:uncharacterized phage-associated protein
MHTLVVERPLRYQFNLDKFLAVLGQLIESCGPMTKLKIVKLLYLLDRRHFNLYGRPVLGDRYLRMEYGPMPTFAKDLIDTIEEKATFRVKPVAEGKLLSRYFKTRRAGTHPEIDLVKAPATDVLSDSEREALSWVIENFGQRSASTLVDITHRHAAWKETQSMAEMDYRLFPKDDAEAVEGIAEIAAIEQQERGELVEALSLDAPA